MPRYRIILADDHALFRQGIRRIIEENPELEVIGEAADGLELLKMLNEADPDMIILDIGMPNLRGLEAAKEIRMTGLKISVLILTMHRDVEYFRYAMKVGARGFLLKEDADTELVSAIKTIREGRRYISPILFKDLTDNLFGLQEGAAEENRDPLTNREREVLKLVAEGKSSREIGHLLHISTRTVQNHRANIMTKLKAKGTSDLVRYALLKGYTGG